MLADLAGLGLTIGGTLFGMNEADKAAERAANAARSAGGLMATGARQAGGVMASGARQAAGEQASGLQQAIGEVRAGARPATDEIIFGRERGLGFLQQLAPFAHGGIGANAILADALGLNGPEAQARYFTNFQNDPGFQATLKAGTDAIEQSAAGPGLLRSGGTLKALQDYGARLQGSIFSDRLNRLAGLGQAGQNAATTMATGSAGLTTNAANSIANIYTGVSDKVSNYLRDLGFSNAGGTTGAANAEAGGILGASNAEAGGIIGASNADQRGTQNKLAMLGFGMGQAKQPLNDLFGSIGKIGKLAFGF